jgi:hypothetical protein
VNGNPLLVTAQGTYGPMQFQGWNPDMSRRWDLEITRETAGARGSHMCPVIDINGDGIDEFFWGERLIEMDRGTRVFCADEQNWHSHSDVIQPVWDKVSTDWLIFTCREGRQKYPPRVVTYNSRAERVWSDIKQGHMDMGWVARLGENGRKIAMAIRIGGKSAGPLGFTRSGIEEFAWDVFTGEKIELPFSVYKTLPVDIDGDGIHELTRTVNKESTVIDNHGEEIAETGGRVVFVGKLFGLAGEQVVSCTADGRVTVWADRNARDSEEAKARYNHPFYGANRKLTATGSNRINLGGL